MTSNYHTPISTGAAANAATFNTPFSQLDSRLVQIATVVDTDGTLKTGAVDIAAVITDGVVATAKLADLAVTAAKIDNATITDAKLAYPVRVAWATVRIGSAISSVSAHTTSDTEWDFGLSAYTQVFALVNRTDTYNTAGIVWDAWVLSDKHVIIRATNVTASTVNINAATDLTVAIVDFAGSLLETTESQVV